MSKSGINLYHFCLFYLYFDSMKLPILSEKSLATPDCFPTYLINAVSMDSCSIYSETGFISEQLCMNIFIPCPHPPPPQTVFVAGGWGILFSRCPSKC